MSRPEHSGFDATLRFELASEEDRPLFVSYLLASLLALAWLILVHTVPAPLLPIIADPGPPMISFVPQPLPISAPPIVARASGTAEGIPERSPLSGLGSVRDAFAGNAGLVDAGNLLRGVDVTPGGSAAREPTSLKVGLGTGVGSRTPGRVRAGGLSPTGAGVAVVGGGGVSRNVVTIAPPEVRPVAGGAPAGNMSEVGQAARAHVPQLERCYYQEGLSRNPALAGLVRLAIIVEGGRVTSAQVIDRTWSGAGVAEAESCLMRSVRGWRLGASDARIVLPLSFTSQAR